MKKVTIVVAALMLMFAGSALMASGEMAEQGEKRIKIGATFSINSISGGNFKDIYGGSVPSFGLDFGYMLTEDVEAWATLSFASKSTTLKEFDNTKTKFKFHPMVSLNGRYHFFRRGAMSVFGGGGLTGYSIKDTVDSPDIKEVKEFLLGFNVHVGCRYNVYDSIWVQGVFRYNFVSKTKEEWDNKLELTGGELLLGVAYGF